MPETYGPDYLRRKLEERRPRILTRYRYYEMKNHVHYVSDIIPKHIWYQFENVLGWCEKSVDNLSARLVFRTFKNDLYGLNTIYAMNNRQVLIPSAIKSALICSCSFLYISTGPDGFPRIQALDGGDATGIMDTTTGMLLEGYAVLQRDRNERPVLEAYFLPGSTTFYRPRMEPQVVENSAPYPLLVPMVFNPDARRPFGRSRISRACMSLVKSAIRTLIRSEVSSDFYAFPQKYASGVSEDAEVDKERATISSFLKFTRDENGDAPTLGQFQQQSMQPYSDMLRMYTSLFAGETGMTLDDLGFASDNPSSQEAIQAAHENLRLTAEAAQGTFGNALVNAGYLAACLRDDFPYQRNQLATTLPAWRPVFRPDAATMAGIGDGVNKINQTVPGYFGPDNVEDLVGIGPDMSSNTTTGGDMTNG